MSKLLNDASRQRLLWPITEAKFRRINRIRKATGDHIGVIIAGFKVNTSEARWYYVGLDGQYGDTQEFGDETRPEEPMLWATWKRCDRKATILTLEHQMSRSHIISHNDALGPDVIGSIWHPAAWRHPDHYWNQRRSKRYEDMWRQVSGSPRQ